MKSVQQPVWACKSFPATQTPHANVTAVPSLAAHVVRSVNLASAAPKFVN